MKILGSTLRSCRDLDTAGTIFGREVTRLYGHFLDHVVVSRDDGAVIRSNIDHARTVNAHVIVDATNPVHRVITVRVRASLKGREIGSLTRIARVRGHDARQYPQQLQAAAPNYGKIVNLLRGDGIGSFAGVSFNWRRFAGDGNSLTRSAHFQGNIQRSRLDW